MKYLFSVVFMLFLCGVNAQQTCLTPTQIQPVMANLDPDPLNGNYCVTVYIEVDHDIVLDKGESGARVFIDGLLSEVAALYQAQDIGLNFIASYWDTPSPYNSNSAGTLLTQFREYRSENGGHPGDVAMLLSYQASGGVAYVDVICRENFGYAFSSIEPDYEEYPVFSWPTEVVAHELGHNLGSNHTHACVWNGDMTAIDGLSPFGVEGSCPAPPRTESGTVMSYGHLSDFGIDFRKGFHPQALAVIKNRIADAVCVECEDGPEPPEPELCDGNRVIIELQLDNYPFETSWRVMDGERIVAASGPFTKAQMNTYQSDTVCLPDGCYSFEIMDADGLKGFGCGEGMYIVNGPVGELASGQDFAGEEITRFCFGDDKGCNKPDLSLTGFVSYANQDRNPSGIEYVDGAVKLTGNTWKAKPYSYRVTPSTVLTGEIFVDSIGEIHAIGLTERIENLAPGLVFRLAGTQGWGRGWDDVTPGTWEPFEIPIGAYVPNIDYNYLLIINDHDRGGMPVASWRNIDFCEEGGTVPMKGLAPIQGKASDESVVVEDIILKPYPNPFTDTLNLPSFEKWEFYTVGAKKVASGNGNKAELSHLKRGVYFLHQGGQFFAVIKM